MCCALGMALSSPLICRRAGGSTKKFWASRCIQTSHNSLLLRKGTDHTYVVVKGPAKRNPMGFLQHNGLDVASADEVDRAFAILQEIKEDYGLGSIRKPTHAHGDYSFYFTDCDDNWWEITATPPGGYRGISATPAPTCGILRAYTSLMT